MLRLLAAVFLLWSYSLAQACPQPECVRIGTWNVEWLGSDKRSQPADRATVQRMADLIAQTWSIDLITLQEINTELDGTHRGTRHSRQPWQALQAALEKQGYQTAEGESGHAQRIVMAWRHPVQALRSPTDLRVRDAFLINEYCRSSNLRKPLAGQFRAGHFDFWLVAVHLKANSGQTACNTAVRTAQANDLAQSILQLQQAEQDILLAGDLNASPRHKSLAPLEGIGLQAVTGKSQRHPHSARFSHIGNPSKKTGSLLDHLLLLPGATTEWHAGSTTIFAPADYRSFETQYSDHLPVWADFSISRDDD